MERDDALLPAAAEPITQTSLKTPPELDPLAMFEGDSFMRRIFLAYTVRIPWITDFENPISRDDEACYLRVTAAKA